MRIRIGCDHDGEPVHIDTTRRTRVALLAPPARGKTTLCRYLARRWLASSTESCLVLTPRGYEFADLRVPVRATPPAAANLEVGGLLLVDETWALPADTARRAIRSGYRVVVMTGFGPEFPPDLCSGLDRQWAPEIDAVYALEHARHRMPIQMRLDWPATTVPVFCDRRRPANFPLHRWAV